MAKRAQSVQFRNIADVIAAYEAAQISDLAIWCGDELQFPYECDSVSEGVSFLESLLGKLKQSAAIYTLRLYQLKDGEEITSKTPWRSSFNFQLRRVGEASEFDVNSGLPMRTGTEGLSQEIASLKLQLEQLRAEREEESSEGDQLGVIGKIIEHPQLGPFVLGLAKDFLKGRKSEPAAMGGGDLSDAMELDRVVKALLQKDPKLCEHLKKLLAIAEKNSLMFATILSQLENLSV